MMQPSNFAELRRVRGEMSKAAGHSARGYVELLSAYRKKYRDRLVNHGAEAEQRISCREIAETSRREAG